jgi:hypothetical protein
VDKISVYSIESNYYGDDRQVLVEGPHRDDFHEFCDSLQPEVWKTALETGVALNEQVNCHEWQEAMVRVLESHGYREVSVPAYRYSHPRTSPDPMQALMGNDLAFAINAHNKKIWYESLSSRSKAKG